MTRYVPASVLALVAAVGAGVLYALHPDDTTRTIVTAVAGGFLTALRVGESIPVTPAPPRAPGDTSTPQPPA